MTIKVTQYNLNEAGEKTWDGMDLQMKVHMLKSVEATARTTSRARNTINFSFVVTAAYGYNNRLVRATAMRAKKRAAQKARKEVNKLLTYSKDISVTALGREYIDAIYAEWDAKEKTPDDIARQNVLDKIKEFKGGALSNVSFDGKSMVN